MKLSATKREPSALVTPGSIESKEILLVGTPASGLGGSMASAKYPGFDELRPELRAMALADERVLNEAARILAAGKVYGSIE